jgi:hypothetical protein
MLIEATGFDVGKIEDHLWLVLSPRAEQIVVHTGHAVEEEDPDLVIEVIRDVVQTAR